MLEGIETVDMVKSREITSKQGDDSAVIELSDDLALVQTIDAFTPLHDDPIIQGKLSACNSLNDIYAMRVTDVVSVLVIMSYPEDMPPNIAKKLLEGFVEFCNEEKAPVVGGHTINNPWPIIGGACTGVAHPKKIIYSHGAKPGDILILTKPLGIQPCMATYRVMNEGKDVRKMVFEVLPEEEAERAVDMAIQLLLSSNKNIATAIDDLDIHASTDVTGFGIKGHAQNIAWLSNVNIELHTLPVIKGALELSDLFLHDLRAGESSETAGGMLLALPRDELDALAQKFTTSRIPYWKVGKVLKGTGKVTLKKDPEILEIDSFP